MLKTLKFALEARTGDVKVGLDHPIIPWMAKHGPLRSAGFRSGQADARAIRTSKDMRAATPCASSARVSSSTR